MKLEFLSDSVVIFIILGLFLENIHIFRGIFRGMQFTD